MNKKPKVHLISFCNIFDDSSSELSSELIRSKILFIEKGNDLFDSVNVWTASKFIAEFPGAHPTLADYYERYRAECQELSLNFNKNWLQAGCFMWKPLLIKFALNTICNEDDILIYHDVNLQRYPKYKHNLALGKSFYIKKIKNHSIILFKDNLRPLYFDCKKWLLEKYLCNYFANGQYLQNFWAGLICIRNDSMGRKFINNWVELSSLDNCAPLPDVSRARRHPNFFWHSQEQSTLAITYYKYLIFFNDSIKILIAPGRKVFSINHSNIKDLVSYILLNNIIFIHYVYVILFALFNLKRIFRDKF